MFGIGVGDDDLIGEEPRMCHAGDADQMRKMRQVVADGREVGPRLRVDERDLDFRIRESMDIPNRTLEATWELSIKL